MMNKIKLAILVTLAFAAVSGIASAGQPTMTGVVFLPSLDPVPQAVSTIQRNANGIRATVQTGFLESSVYTMWILIWNDPANDPNCDPAAPFCTPGTADCVIYGTGHLIGSSGLGSFATHLNVGDTSRVFGGGNCGAGLTDAMGAEIHLVVADHGDLDPDQLPGAIKTPGPGVQAAVHKP